MDYQQISCSLFDRIESLSVSKKNVEIIYLSENDKDSSIIGFIRDVYSKNKAEFLSINDITIRLDRIKSINEH